MKTRRIIVLLIAILFILPSIAAARYYNPQTGRYLTPDPIGLEGGINPYVYVGNDPVNEVDPWGLMESACEAEGCPATIHGIMGGAPHSMGGMGAFEKRG